MRVMALIYHDVRADEAPRTANEDRVEDWYTLDADAFAAHLDAIAATPVQPTVVASDARMESLFLTFDDGGESAITTVAPLLERHGWHGHFFIITDRIGRPGFLGEDGLRELAARGHVVGSHSHTHPIMTKLGDSELADEWRTSREILETILGSPVKIASVPTGYYDARVGRVALESGYVNLFTSEPWLKPRTAANAAIYGRFSIRRTTTIETVRGLCAFSPRVVVRERAGWTVRKAMKTALGPGYETLRAAVIRRRG